MEDVRPFRTVAAATAIASATVAGISGLLFVATTGGDLDILVNRPAQLLSIGPRDAEVLRWALITDMLGSYLLVIPVIWYLRDWLRGEPAVDLYAVCGIAYAVIGAVGAALLAAAAPPMIRQYAAATIERQAAIEPAFGGLVNGVWRGLWQTLETIPLGVASIGFGRLLGRRDRAIGGLAVAGGAAALGVSVARIIDVDALATVPLLAALVLAPAWIALLGARLIRGPDR